MLIFPNTKINIGLNILEKRQDAYHNIESLLYPINFTDILDVVESEDSKVESWYEFEQSGQKLDISPEENLCIKALKLLKKEYFIPKVKIQLHKLVPTGSGLGGGSSDAVFMLKAINELFSIGISEDKMLEYSAILGSDCSFFVKNKPSIIKGRGDLLYGSDLSLAGHQLVLVLPGKAVNTNYAFSIITTRIPEICLEEIIDKPLETWKDSLNNDFEKAIINIYPEIGLIKEKLYKMGAVYASMSGSGSSVYGIFDKKIKPGNIFGNYLVYTQIL